MNDRSHPLPLDLSPAEIEALAARAGRLLAETAAALPDRPASQNAPSSELLAEVYAPPPEGPQPLDGLLDVVRRAAAASYETAGPSYLAYIPGGGIFSAALGDFLAAGLNRYTGRAGPAPACVALEESVLRWMCDLFEMPASSQGLLTTGGSLSNLIAVVAARTKHAEGAVDRAAIYVGEHAHGSMVKSARTAGIAADRVRQIRSTPDLRMDPEDLRRRVAEDRNAGLIPVCISAAAGTTNTGTIDPLPQIASVAEEAGVWYHIDAAYGGFFRLTARGRERLAGIERADSITLDPHKSLFLPFGTGALVVRSSSDLKRAFAEEADYLQDLGDAGGIPDFDTLSPELTREWRGLRLWLPLHLHGVDAFRRQLDEKLDLAERAHAVLAADPRLELHGRPDLTVIPFRLKGAADSAQRRFLNRINASQRILISSTRLGGETWLRLAILSLRTHADRVEEALEIIRGAAG
jgi:aromatic-L-amino-acid/L-tryptophan decarboxylase